jgi:alpha-galactosidase
MQGHVNVSTFESMADDPKTAPILKEMRDASGKPRVCDTVWISSIGCADDDTTEQKGKLTTGFGASSDEIGPEFTFGIYIEKTLNEPILLIKTSWGGKSLHTDFRPPGLSRCRQNHGPDRQGLCHRNSESPETRVIASSSEI